MRRKQWLLVTMTVVLTLSSRLSTHAASAPSQPSEVYVANNGSCYHLADCPRVRFARPMPLAAAAARYRPCPVCLGVVAPAGAYGDSRPKGDQVDSRAREAASGGAEASRAPDAPVAATRAAGDRPPESRRKGSGHGRAFHASVGALLGFGAGFALYNVGAKDDFLRTEVSCLFGAFGAGVGALVGALGPWQQQDRALAGGRDVPGRERGEVAPGIIAAAYRFDSQGPGAGSFGRMSGRPGAACASPPADGR